MDDKARVRAYLEGKLAGITIGADLMSKAIDSNAPNMLAELCETRETIMLYFCAIDDAIETHRDIKWEDRELV